MNLPNIQVKLLKTKKQIDDASALLYNVYVEHMGWEFDEQNPSQLRIVSKKGRLLLEDRFTCIATWFGAYDGDLLVGCSRLCGLDKNGKFEVQGYSGSDVIDKYLSDSCLECNRVAASPDHKIDRVLERLFFSMLEYAYKSRKNFFGLTAYAYFRSLFVRIGLPLLVEKAFFYDKSRDRTAVNLYLIDYSLGGYPEILGKLSDIIYPNKNDNGSVLSMLETFASIVPIPMYWHDLNGVVLGLNEHCMRGMGATKISDIIGKTPYDFYPKKNAEKILSHNLQVMLSGEVLTQEEEFVNLTTGKVEYARSIKTPLYDTHGHAIGIVGVSVVITAEKEAEQLKMQHTAYEERLKTHEMLMKCLRNIQNTLQVTQHEAIKNDKVLCGRKLRNSSIKLTKREREVLHYLSINKSPKEIANILAKKENKPLSALTVSSIIDKKLYPKFAVFSVSQLIAKAVLLNLIPFVPEDHCE